LKINENPEWFLAWELIKTIQEYINQKNIVLDRQENTKSSIMNLLLNLWKKIKK
jgi:hypothetical protein